MSKPYTLTLTLSLKGEGINGWTLIKGHPQRPFSPPLEGERSKVLIQSMTPPPTPQLAFFRVRV
jgi:hypothetical protein